MVKKIAATLWREAREMLPPALYFLVSFNLLVLTVQELDPAYGTTTVSYVTATIGALLVGKAVLLADVLPFFHRHAHRPLVYNTAWKAFLYFAVTLVLHLVERVITIARGRYGLVNGIEDVASHFNWPHFLVVQLWLALLLLIYSACREVVQALGPRRMFALFFVTPAPAHGSAPASEPDS